MSTEEQAREELARIEARIVGLDADNARLRAQLSAPGDVRIMIVFGAVASLLAATASYGVAARGTECRAIDDRAASAELHRQRLTQERAVAESCAATSRRVALDLAQCQTARAQVDVGTGSPSSRCPPGEICAILR
ncbi:MAG: hypothetical protein JWP97_39 [Labilithrix sp.]|nr:hypothetical protein [Labilithrix sp.]